MCFMYQSHNYASFVGPWLDLQVYKCYNIMILSHQGHRCKNYPDLLEELLGHKTE